MHFETARRVGAPTGSDLAHCQLVTKACDLRTIDSPIERRTKREREKVGESNEPAKCTGKGVGCKR